MLKADVKGCFLRQHDHDTPMQETVLPGANAPYPTVIYILIPLLPLLGFL